MAKYDQGGGCPCGLYAECEPGCEHAPKPAPKPAARAAYPDDNPKTAVGVTKPPLHAIPPVALLLLGRAMADGERKYGLCNWRERTVSASIYYDAMLRHLLAWWDGEDVAPDSGIPHLAHIAACAAILLDVGSLGKLNDDRPKPGMAGAYIAAAAAAHAGGGA